MPDEIKTQLTSVQTDSETSRMLGLVAQAHERSKAAQLRVLVRREYDELARLKLLPALQVQDEPVESFDCAADERGSAQDGAL